MNHIVIEKYFGTELARKALKFYGVETKKMHLNEELCELYAAISHYIRKERENDEDAIAEEMCDVILLIDELWDVYGDRIGASLFNNTTSNQSWVAEMRQLLIHIPHALITEGYQSGVLVPYELARILRHIDNLWPHLGQKIDKCLEKKYEIVKQRIASAEDSVNE